MNKNDTKKSQKNLSFKSGVRAGAAGAPAPARID